MMLANESFRCRGINYSITLDTNRIIIQTSWFAGQESFELPIERVRSIIVERRSVIPFASLTMIAAIVAVTAKYNLLSFLGHLASEGLMKFGSIAPVASVLFSIPTISRALFVNVIITWDGTPTLFRVRFVPAHVGKRLAARFWQLSSKEDGDS